MKHGKLLTICFNCVLLGVLFYVQLFTYKQNFNTERIFVDNLIIIPKPIIVKTDIQLDSVNIPSGNPIPTNNELSSLFGLRVHPVSKRLKFHTGIDLSCPQGSPVVSTANGRIIRIQYSNSGYGNNIVIEHNGSYRTLYGHLLDISVKVNQLVSKGEVIGYSGNTGTSTAPHLHYEVIVDNLKTNPIAFL